MATFLAPTRHTLHAGSLVLAAFRRVTGTGLLDDLTTFFGLLSDLVDGFHERAEDVQRLLRDETTAFLIVTSPERTAVDETIFFATELERPACTEAELLLIEGGPARAGRPWGHG